MFQKRRNPNEIYDDSEDKKAIPELEFKRSIFNSVIMLGDLENSLFTNYERSGSFRKLDIIVFEREIIRLFDYIKYMIKSSGKMNKKHEEAYLMIVQFKFKAREASVKELLASKDFLLEFCHILSITNLLIGGGKDFITLTKDEY